MRALLLPSNYSCCIPASQNVGKAPASQTILSIEEYKNKNLCSFLLFLFAWIALCHYFKASVHS